MMIIYLIKNSEGFYKIGRTKNNAMDRLKQLQTGSSSELKLVKACNSEAGSKVESILHNRYKGYNVQGEWFDLPEKEVDTFEKNVSTITEMVMSLKKSGNPFI